MKDITDQKRKKKPTARRRGEWVGFGVSALLWGGGSGGQRGRTRYRASYGDEKETRQLGEADGAADAADRSGDAGDDEEGLDEDAVGNVSCAGDDEAADHGGRVRCDPLHDSCHRNAHRGNRRRSCGRRRSE